MTETALAHDTHDNSEIVLPGSAPNIIYKYNCYERFFPSLIAH
jgi:hypothetical protein